MHFQKNPKLAENGQLFCMHFFGNFFDVFCERKNVQKKWMRTNGWLMCGGWKGGEEEPTNQQSTHLIWNEYGWAKGQGSYPNKQGENFTIRTDFAHLFFAGKFAHYFGFAHNILFFFLQNLKIPFGMCLPQFVARALPAPPPPPVAAFVRVVVSWWRWW